MMGQRTIHIVILLFWLVATAVLVQAVSSATTQIHIVKYANDRTTILAEQTLTWQEMRDTLPVQGDGSTHYYHQGPVFVDDPDEATEQALRWNPGEDTNVQEKDMGAVKGTDVRDLCDLVGGMSMGDTLVIRAADGMKKEFAYANVYSPPSRQGAMVITWYCSGSTFSDCSGPYPDSGYADGMRLVFFADTSVNQWGIHAFGNYDWHESADPEYWYYYASGPEQFPTTTGLSVKYISDLIIYSKEPAGSSSRSSGVPLAALSAAGSAPPDDPDKYGYKGKTLNTFISGTLNGTVRFFSDMAGGPLVVNNRIREFNISVDVPSGSNITLARLYLYISGSHNLQSGKGVIPMVSTALSNRRLENDLWYFDTDGDDSRHVAATYAYDIRDLIQGNGPYTVAVSNSDFEQSVFTADGVLLVLAVENETSPPTTYWIDEGCDVISSRPEKGLLPDDCGTSYPFAGTVNMSAARHAGLYLVSTGLDRDNATEHIVNFNEGSCRNFFDNTTSSVIQHFLPVRDYLNETGNAAEVRSSISTQDADYLVNRNAILVVGFEDPGASVSPVNASSPAQVLRSPPADIPVAIVAGNMSGGTTVSLDTDPGGALIYLDGTYLGKTTPYILDVEPGESHTVRFELDGYVPSETAFADGNETTIHASLYAPVYSQKRRLSVQPEDPDGIRYGGVFVNSRPQGATITVDGIKTGKTTPFMVTGLRPGSHTIGLALDHSDTLARGTGDFFFEETKVVVLQGVLGFIDVNGISHAQQRDLIIDSRQARGVPFSVNGYLSDATIPAKVTAPLFNSFVTIHENESFVSYQLPVLTGDDRYLLLEPRSFQNLAIAVDSDPRGAEIIIDGFRTGYATPHTIGNLSDGFHRILVTKDGYIPRENLIGLPYRPVPVSTIPVDFILDEYPDGFLYVTSNPAGGGVSIDGIDTGEITPAFFRSVPTGSHSVKVTGTNTTKTIPDVTVNSLTMTNVTVDLNGFTGA